MVLIWLCYACDMVLIRCCPEHDSMLKKRFIRYFYQKRKTPEETPGLNEL